MDAILGREEHAKLARIIREGIETANRAGSDRMDRRGAEGELAREVRREGNRGRDADGVADNLGGFYHRLVGRRTRANCPPIERMRTHFQTQWNHGWTDHQVAEHRANYAASIAGSMSLDGENCLREPATLEEVKDALKRLANGKSRGLCKAVGKAEAVGKTNIENAFYV